MFIGMNKNKYIIKIFLVILILLYFEDIVYSVSLLEAYNIRKQVRNDLDAPRHIYKTPQTIGRDIENTPSLFIGDNGEFFVAPPVNKLKQYLELAKERIDFEKEYHHRHARLPTN